MAEAEFHVDAIRLLFDALQDHFASRDDVYVVGMMNWYRNWIISEN